MSISGGIVAVIDHNASLDAITKALMTGIQDALQGIPVTINQYGLSCGEEISEEEICSVIRILDKGPQRSNTVFRFARGDFWNRLPSAYGAKKRFIRQCYPDATEEEIQRIYNDWKHCAKIAARWPHGKRNNKWAWNFFKTHSPGADGGHIEIQSNSTAPEDGGQSPPIQGAFDFEYAVAWHSPNAKEVTVTDFGRITAYPRNGGKPIIIDLSVTMGGVHKAAADSEGDDFAEREYVSTLDSLLDSIPVDL